MKVQKSFNQDKKHLNIGKLYLVGTPIGNLEDMTYRAIRTLGEVDWIAAEDTRQTRKLLSHYEITTRLVSYHEHNKEASGKELIHQMLGGKSIALVSDAGLPAISDPGYELVRSAIEHDIDVIPIPGANAALSALIISGLDTSRFRFIGFLPKDKKKTISILEQLKNTADSMLFYESPHRVEKTLKQMEGVWGNRNIALARELTKRYEEVVRGTINECIAFLQEYPAKGEYCIVVEGSSPIEADLEEQMRWYQLSIEEHMEFYENEGMDRKEAMKKVALDRKVPKREIYNKLI